MRFSIVIFLTVFLYWHLGFSARLWLGVFGGFVADSLSIFPFGTYTLIFIFTALLIEILQYIFSNTDSLFTKGVAVGTVFFVANSFLYPLSYLIGQAQKIFLPWDARAEISIIIWSFIPAVALFAVFSLIHFLQIKKC